MASKPVMMMCDKGDGNGKREGTSFIKLLARFSKEWEKVGVTSIGIEGAGNITHSRSNGIDHSLTLFDSPDKRI